MKGHNVQRRILVPIACAAVLVVLGPASAQPPSGGGMDDVKKQLGASDEEWKVISPKLQKVIAARQTLAADARGPAAGGSFRGGFGGFPGGPGGGFPGGPRGPGAPPQPGQILTAPLQEMLQLTAEQKKQMEALQKEVDAKLAKILTDEQKKQLQEMQNGGFPGGAGGAFGGPGGGPPGGVGGPTPSNAISQAQAELKTTLSDPKHTADEVKEKVAAVRKARQKVRTELEAAQKDLLKLLTPEQEATLISLGYIE